MVHCLRCREMWAPPRTVFSVQAQPTEPPGLNPGTALRIRRIASIPVYSPSTRSYRKMLSVLVGATSTRGCPVGFHDIGTNVVEVVGVHVGGRDPEWFSQSPKRLTLSLGAHVVRWSVSRGFTLAITSESLVFDRR